MVALKGHTKTALACITMEEVLATSDPADATAVTMKDFLFFSIVIKEVADTTEISRKLNSTAFTVLLGFLHFLAVHALNFLDSFSVKLMILLRIHFVLVLDLVVAESAGKVLLASWASLLAPPLVVFAPKLFIFWYLLFFRLQRFEFCFSFLVNVFEFFIIFDYVFLAIQLVVWLIAIIVVLHYFGYWS
jgi:hypothetical protein